MVQTQELQSLEQTSLRTRLPDRQGQVRAFLEGIETLALQRLPRRQAYEPIAETPIWISRTGCGFGRRER